MKKTYYHFHPISQFALKNLFYVSGGGYLVNRPKFHVDRDYFDDYQCVYVIDGIFHFEQHGKRIKVKKGETIVFSMKEPHKYYFTKQDGGEILWMHFDGEYCAKLMSRLQLPVVYNSELTEFTINKCLATIKDRNKNYEFELSGYVYSFILDLLQKCSTDIDDAAPVISMVDEYIQKHLSETIKLKDLSEYTSISIYHLCHIFKMKTGMAPIQYVLYKKIDMATKMLTNSNLKINQLYSMLGFSDQSHFSNTFKKIIGMSPLNFKKSHYK